MSDEVSPANRDSVSQGLRFASGSVTLRFIAVAVIFVVLLVPMGLEGVLLQDRESNRDEAHRNIAQSWSGPQELPGPILLVPVELKASASTKSQTGVVRVAPYEFKASVHSVHEVRSRGIHSVPLLSAEIQLTGTFEKFNFEELGERFEMVHWSQAVLGVPIPDTRGIQEFNIWLDGNSDASAVQSGIGLDGSLSGVHAPISLVEPVTDISFKIELTLRASERLRIVPIGETSSIQMSGTWPHPKFDGRHLPDSRKVSETGFEAAWKVHGLARGFPSQLYFEDFSSARNILWSDSEYFEADVSVGFSLLDPLSPYRWLGRTFKHGILIVALTLTTVLCLELILGVRLHVVQYGVVGIAQVFFFLLLLSLAEHIGFTLGYVAGATVLTGMIGAFVYGATHNRLASAVLTGAVALLYAVLFLVLSQEVYALLTGTLLLLLMLATLMWSTRKLGRTATVD